MDIQLMDSSVFAPSTRGRAGFRGAMRWFMEREARTMAVTTLVSDEVRLGTAWQLGSYATASGAVMDRFLHRPNRPAAGYARMLRDEWEAHAYTVFSTDLPVFRSAHAYWGLREVREAQSRMNYLMGFDRLLTQRERREDALRASSWFDGCSALAAELVESAPEALPRPEATASRPPSEDRRIAPRETRAGPGEPDPACTPARPA